MWAPMGNCNPRRTRSPATGSVTPQQGCVSAEGTDPVAVLWVRRGRCVNRTSHHDERQVRRSLAVHARGDLLPGVGRPRLRRCRLAVSRSVASAVCGTATVTVSDPCSGPTRPIRPSARVAPHRHSRTKFHAGRPAPDHIIAGLRPGVRSPRRPVFARYRPRRSWNAIGSVPSSGPNSAACLGQLSSTRRFPLVTRYTPSGDELARVTRKTLGVNRLHESPPSGRVNGADWAKQCCSRRHRLAYLDTLNSSGFAVGDVSPLAIGFGTG